jgi:hypothetical protein
MLAVVGAFGASSGEARAVSLNPGPGELTPAGISMPGNLTQVGSSKSMNFGLSGVGTSGSIVETVYKTQAGTYDFTYLLTVNSTDSVTRLTLTNFTGFSVDADYVSSSSGTAPTSVDRTTGDTVGFTFTGLGGGASSALLIIQTNATGFDTNGTVAPGGSLTGTLHGFFAPTPEPSTLVLALTGGLPCLGFGWLRRRRQA